MTDRIAPLLLLIALCLCPLIHPAAQTTFTAADAIRVETLRSPALSPDGRWLAGLRSASTQNRFGIDHFRFRDPTYLRPANYDLVLYDLEDGSARVLASGNLRQLRWSDDSRQLAFFIVIGDSYQLQVLDAAAGRVRTIALQGNLAIAANSELEWLPDHRSVLLSLRATDWLSRGMQLYREATAGPVTVYDSEEPFLKWDAIGLHQDRSVLARVTLRTGATEEILPEGRYRNLHVDRRDGAFLVVEEDIPQRTDYQRKKGFKHAWKKIDLYDPADSTRLRDWSTEQDRLTFSRDNHWIAWADSGDVKVRSLLQDSVRNLTAGKTLLSDTDTTEVKFSVELWSPGADRLVARSKQGLWLIDPETGDRKRFLIFDEEDKQAPRYEVEAWAADGAQLYLSYAATDQWQRGIYRYDLDRDTLEALLLTTDLLRSWELAENGSRWIYRASDGDRPDEYFTADPTLANRRQVTDLNPWAQDKQFTKSELVRYLDADGEELYGILYYPVDYDSTQRYPLVCEIYEDFFDNGYRPSVNILANQGYFAFRPSVNLEKGRPGVAWVKGVTAGINKLIERDLVDPERIGVHGTSYGGYAASLLIAQTDRFATAINISGKTNMISFLGDSPRIGTRNYSAAEVGQDRIGESLWEAPLKYIEHSAIFYADKIDTPHLLLTGGGDWNVPAANTREMYYALRRLGKKVVWVDYPTAGHGAGWAGTESTYLDQWERILDWYAEYLKEEEANTPPAGTE